MSSNDLVKFITQEFVKYMDTPKSSRREKQKEKWSTRWFGMIPMSINMMFRRRR